MFSYIFYKNSVFFHFNQCNIQGRSIVFVIGETYYKHRTCKGERRRREAVLGGCGGMLPRKFFEKLVQFGEFWLIF